MCHSIHVKARGQSAEVHSPYHCVDTSAISLAPVLMDLTEGVVVQICRESVTHAPCPVSSWGSQRSTI